MAVVVIIPARYGSTRFHAKLLQDLAGKPIIQHVYERSLQAKADQVVVATDDQRIVDVVTSFSGKAILTDTTHHSGTERIAEAIDILKLRDDDIVINVQGDEPMLHPELVDQIVDNLQKYPRFKMATLCERFTELADLQDPNKVKVIFNHDGSARYFSRSVIPFARDHFRENPEVMPDDIDYYLHLGIYAYRASFVKRYVTWPQAPWEKVEALEQLRVLWNDELIHVAEACQKIGPGIDTQEDLERVRQAWRFA